MHDADHHQRRDLGAVRACHRDRSHCMFSAISSSNQDSLVPILVYTKQDFPLHPGCPSWVLACRLHYRGYLDLRHSRADPVEVADWVQGHR
jgi:hypothetical protein